MVSEVAWGCVEEGLLVAANPEVVYQSIEARFSLLIGLRMRKPQSMSALP